MIRDMKFADIHAVTGFLLERHRRSVYANGLADMDVAEVKRLLGAGIGRHGHRTGGACFLQVADNDGAVHGLIYASLYRVCSVYDKLFATYLFWLANEPSDAVALMENMLAWAKSSPQVIEVQCNETNVFAGRPEITGPMLERLGMKPYGAVYRLEFGERTWVQSSAA